MSAWSWRYDLKPECFPFLCVSSRVNLFKFLLRSSQCQLCPVRVDRRQNKQWEGWHSCWGQASLAELLFRDVRFATAEVRLHARPNHWDRSIKHRRNSESPNIFKPFNLVSGCLKCVLFHQNGDSSSCTKCVKNATEGDNIRKLAGVPAALPALVGKDVFGQPRLLPSCN